MGPIVANSQSGMITLNWSHGYQSGTSESGILTKRSAHLALTSSFATSDGITAAMRRAGLWRKSILIVVSAIGVIVLWSWTDSLGSFGLHSRLLHIPLGPDLQAKDLALSPDGRQIAILDRWTGIPGESGHEADQQDRIAILDTASDRQVATIFPPAGDWNKGKQLPVDQSLRYCDNGRYILAFIGMDTLFAFRTSDYAAQTAIRLGGIPPPGSIPVPAHSDLHPGIWFGQIPREPPPQFDIPGVHSLTFFQGSAMFSGFQIDCAKASPFLVVSANGLVRVINLDTGQVAGEIGSAFPHYWDNGSTAISPDGSRVAVVELNPRPHRDRVGVADVHTGQRIFSADLGFPDGVASIYQLAFAGNHTLLAAEKPSDEGSEFYDGHGPGKGQMPLEPPEESWFLHNTIWALDLDAGGKKREFSQFGRRACAYISASADGKVILGRSRLEFRHRRDEFQSVLDVVKDRIVFWNLDSGRQIAQSPSLQIDQSFLYPFLDLETGGLISGQYFQDTSEVRMSDDGRSAISYMMPKDQIRFYHWN